MYKLTWNNQEKDILDLDKIIKFLQERQEEENSWPVRREYASAIGTLQDLRKMLRTACDGSAHFEDHTGEIIQ